MLLTIQKNWDLLMFQSIQQSQKNYRYTNILLLYLYDFTEVAAKSGISVFTISSFENGSSCGITLASFIKLLRAIDFLEEIEKLLPELPESPRAIFQKQSKKQRLWK